TLRRFSEAWNMAVTVSFRRNDLFPNDHPLFAGELGVANSDEQLMAFSSSDLIVAVGTRLGDITTQGFSFPTPPRSRQPLIHVHASQRVLGALFACEVAIPADPITFLQQLLDRNGRAPAGRDVWNVRLSENRRQVAHWSPRHARDGVPMNNVIHRVGQLLPADAIVATDAGIHAGGVYRYIAYSASRRLLAPVSGSMGYGMPAGVAAALRYPGRKVVVFVGDGGFLMTGSELATAVQHRLPVCVVLSNNRSYGSVRVWQERDYPGRLVGTDLHNPDFAALANAYGARGYRIDSNDDIDRVLEPALAEPGPTLIEVRSSLEVNFPKR
ncbi:MAG: thiamine pyrophosphate-dependent enzyme, partial [Phycisphaerales bacterium]|nr:thiamine pyrophosphate-dependent enzyme [Phycisphaerales bacterium]